MRYAPGHREEARKKILAAAGRGFRKAGFGGIGVDGLAQEAGVTSGAFYGHFPSKAEAFKEAAVSGLVELRQAVEQMRASGDPRWLEKFADFYMTAKRTCDLGDSCALQSLTPEVARSDDETKAAFEAELLKVADTVAEGLTGGSMAARRKTAWSILAVLSGGVSLARSAADPKTGTQIANAVKAAAINIANQE